MKITMTPFGQMNSVTPFLLGDDSNVIINSLSNPNGAGGLIEGGLLPDIAIATQRDELIDSEYVQELTRGNKQTSYTWKVQRVASSPDVMAAFLADHGDLVPVNGTLNIYIANTVRYLKNAVMKSIRGIENSNLSVVFTYQVSGSYIPPIYGAAGTGTGGTFTTS